jgi:hypothetical protein
MSHGINAAAMEGHRDLLPARRHSCRAFVRPQTSGLQAVFLTPDTRFVATTVHGRTGTYRDLAGQPTAPYNQIAMLHGAHAGCRADQASIGERLSAVPGMRPMICVGEA